VEHQLYFQEDLKKNQLTRRKFDKKIVPTFPRIMKWTYSVSNKKVASAALFSLCLLVLFSNYIDRHHSKHVQNSISTLYEDRLIVEGYILKMTNDIYQIKEVLNASTSNGEGADGRIAHLLSDITKISDAYQKTRLTKSENIKFTSLVSLMNEFGPTHHQSVQSKSENANQALVLLNELSSIQLEESKLIMERAHMLYISGKTSLQFAFAIILIILVVLQALVFTSKTIRTSNQTSAPYLN